jgi:hypothetical protein
VFSPASRVESTHSSFRRTATPTPIARTKLARNMLDCSTTAPNENVRRSACPKDPDKCPTWWDADGWGDRAFIAWSQSMDWESHPRHLDLSKNLGKIHSNGETLGHAWLGVLGCKWRRRIYRRGGSVRIVVSRCDLRPKRTRRSSGRNCSGTGGAEQGPGRRAVVLRQLAFSRVQAS